MKIDVRIWFSGGYIARQMEFAFPPRDGDQVELWATGDDGGPSAIELEAGGYYFSHCVDGSTTLVTWLDEPLPTYRYRLLSSGWDIEPVPTSGGDDGQEIHGDGLD